MLFARFGFCMLHAILIQLRLHCLVHVILAPVHGGIRSAASPFILSIIYATLRESRRTLPFPPPKLSGLVIPPMTPDADSVWCEPPRSPPDPGPASFHRAPVGEVPLDSWGVSFPSQPWCPPPSSVPGIARSPRPLDPSFSSARGTPRPIS